MAVIKSLSNNTVFRLFMKMMLIISLIVLFDRIIGMVLGKYYFSQESGGYYRTTYAMDSTTADILVLGSSRANHSYVPEIFEDSLGLTCYNTGKDGNHVLYNYALFRTVLKRYNPSILIFDITPDNLSFAASEYDRLSVLLPYYRKHPEIAEIISYRGPFEKVKLLSSIYPFNSMIFRIAMGNLELNKNRERDFNGYVPLFRTMEYEERDTLKSNISIPDELKINALQEIAATCQQKNIDLFFICSPFWYIRSKNQYDTLISEISTSDDAVWLDMSNDSAFSTNSDYFADISHLNDQGARFFSATLINEIRNLR